MDRALGLTDVDHERLLLVIDASFKIVRRHHFYLWAQGILQSMLPHRALLCVAVETEKQRVVTDLYSSVPLKEADAARLCDVRSGLGVRCLDEWYRRGARPIATTVGEHARDSRMGADFDAIGLGWGAVHGTLVPGGRPGCAFVLLDAGAAPGKGTEYLLEMLVPYMSVAWIRSSANESRQGGEPSGERSPLTVREAEILHWVQQGKSNAEIAARLHISALTVKNHVQNILRKLNVQNRAQAAARGIMWDIVRPPT